MNTKVIDSNTLKTEINTAPRDGTNIIVVHSDGETSEAFWSDRPVCMLGSRCGGFPPGWATSGNETDYNLPIRDDVIGWIKEL